MNVERRREDAIAIWQAGVDAVRSDHLVSNFVSVSNTQLRIGDETLPLAEIERIAVVGCGKAGAGMAAGLEAAFGDELLKSKRVTGWVNVPEDCVPSRRPAGHEAGEQPASELKTIHLHGARPAGVNEPTTEGVAGAERILEIVQSLGPRDVCFCLISGGGSALLPAPVKGVSLEDKQSVTKHLSAAGANINQLNTVRKQLSRLKGGGLARACRAGRLASLIISDVLGNPLDIIASGPTVPDPSTPQDALNVLQQFGGIAPPAVGEYLKQRAEQATAKESSTNCKLSNAIIGENATAVAAAVKEAERRGYVTEYESAAHAECEAEDVGRRLVDQIRAQGDTLKAGQPYCFISGGEPIVKLAPADQRGRGGRNQQLVLAALEHLLKDDSRNWIDELTVLSGGTDGEDGPTDAAGALVDALLVDKMKGLHQGTSRQHNPSDFLQRNDAYHFFQPLDGLLKTGPTHTNVCDLRVVLRG